MSLTRTVNLVKLLQLESVSSVSRNSPTFTVAGISIAYVGAKTEVVISGGVSWGISGVFSVVGSSVVDGSMGVEGSVEVDGSSVVDGSSGVDDSSVVGGSTGFGISMAILK